MGGHSISQTGVQKSPLEPQSNSPRTSELRRERKVQGGRSQDGMERAGRREREGKIPEKVPKLTSF